LFPDYSLQTSKKASQPIVDTAELISDLQAQGVNVTPEFFQQILDQSHLNYLVPPVRANKITPVGSLLARLGDLEPAPVEGWRVHLADLITKLGTLQKDANETDVALAYGSISEVAAEADQFVKRRLGSTYSIIEKWINNDTKQLFEIVLAYLITPLQRLITRYDIDKLKTPRIYDLAPGHQDDLNKVLAAHTENLKKFSGSFTTGLAAAKVSYFLDQIQGLAEFAQEIQPARTPGGEIGSRYLKKILFLGPFAELLDFNRVPPVYKGDVAAESLVDKSGSTLVAFLGTCFKHFMGESLSYSPDEVRLRIAKAKEKEKMNIIEDLDAMEEDAKRVELVKKVLGIGRWAIGGSKLIYAYDQDQYEKERDERVRRGETDLPYELGTTAPGNNQVFDIFTSGNAGAPDAFYEAQGGYDVAQESSDDF
jgi:hypothetical protein